MLDDAKAQCQPLNGYCAPAFRVYTAWICVAAIANISTVQTAMGWDNVTWKPLPGHLKLALAGAIGATVLVRKADIAFISVIAWAAFGISVMQAETPLPGRGCIMPVLYGSHTGGVCFTSLFAFIQRVARW